MSMKQLLQALPAEFQGIVCPKFNEEIRCPNLDDAQVPVRL